MVDWFWLWLEGLLQKRAERRLRKAEFFVNTLLKAEDADLARELGILAPNPIVTHTHHVVQSNPELQAAVGAVLRALYEPGAHPAHHRALMSQHRQEWPVLWKSLDRLTQAQTDPCLYGDARMQQIQNSLGGAAGGLLGGILGTIAGGPAGGVLGRDIGSAIGNGRRV